MKNMIMIPILLLLYGCGSEPELNCGCDSQVIDEFENLNGTVILLNSEYYIWLDFIKDGIVNKLTLPCESLSNNYSKEGLRVLLSGYLKNPCPVESPDVREIMFTPAEITKITILDI